MPVNSVNLPSLIKHLNKNCSNALDAAVGMASSLSHYQVEVPHFLFKLLSDEKTELYCILQCLNINIGDLKQDFLDRVENYKTGNNEVPSLSLNLVELFRESWMQASLDDNLALISSGSIIKTLYSHSGLQQQIIQYSNIFENVSINTISNAMSGIEPESPEHEMKKTSVSRGSTALDKFTVSLNEQAKQGRIDPAVERDIEVQQVIDILGRRRQNNPILTGEPGVGKTAIVEGLALLVIEEKVPEILLGVEIRTLDLALLQAGAGVKGEFENRLKAVIDEVKASAIPIILFIDEAHTLIGSGGQAGQMDAANLLKPALARGELRTIAATTWSEYKKYIEKDPALTRRFQIVNILEPSEEQALVMLRGLADKLESHHKIEILDEAIEQAVKLTHRYMPERFLPDKAISVLDTASARVARSQQSIPGKLIFYKNKIEQINVELKRLISEQVISSDFVQRIAQLEKEKEKLNDDIQVISSRYEEERRLVGNIRQAMKRMSEKSGSVMPNLENNENFTFLMNELDDIQQQDPLVELFVDGNSVAEVVASWTGIPVGNMQRSEYDNVMSLSNKLKDNIIGQSYGTTLISERVLISKAKISDPNKPIGVFLLVGPSGVGKTETALALAEQIYGGSGNITTINMSEYKEEHKVSQLMGSSPGYVGYGEGGILTEAVRRRPHSLILLDEVEKAHPSVQEIFYQVFDKGVLRDGEGRDVDFKNTTIIMTSNACSSEIVQLAKSSSGHLPNSDELIKQLMPSLKDHFKPAFLGRTTIIPYMPLNKQDMRQITEIKLCKIKARLHEQYKANVSYENTIYDYILSECQLSSMGARQIDNVISNNILPVLSKSLLLNLNSGHKIKNILLGYEEELKINIEVFQPIKNSKTEAVRS